MSSHFCLFSKLTYIENLKKAEVTYNISLTHHRLHFSGEEELNDENEKGSGGLFKLKFMF